MFPMNAWMRLSMSTWSMGMEASSVIAMRLMKIATGGPGALAESHRMIAEKMAAATSLQAKAMSGALGMTPQTAASRTLMHYRRKVHANHKRLSRGA